MANFLGTIAGLSAAAFAGSKSRQSDHDRLNAYRVANGLKPMEYQKAPIDKAIDWIGDKFKGAEGVATADKLPAAAPAAAPSADPASGDDVGLWERLKAGNIDAPGSEAYNRWGAGRQAGIESSDARQMERLSALPKPAVPGEVDPVAKLDESSRLDSEQHYNAMEEGENSPDRTDTPVTPKEWEAIPDGNQVNEDSMNGWIDKQ